MTFDKLSRWAPKIICLVLGFGILVSLFYNADSWARGGLRSWDRGGLLWVMSWILAFLGVFATLITFIIPYLRVIAAAPAILAGGLMLAATLVADAEILAQVNIRAAAPLFLLGDVLVVVAALLGKPLPDRDGE